MKAKKLVAVGMTVLMLGGLFVGCGNSADTSTGANSGKNVKITIFQSKIEANEGYKKLIAAYEKDHPNVEINLEAVTGNDFGCINESKDAVGSTNNLFCRWFFGHERLRRCY